MRVWLCRRIYYGLPYEIIMYPLSLSTEAPVLKRRLHCHQKIEYNLDDFNRIGFAVSTDLQVR